MNKKFYIIFISILTIFLIFFTVTKINKLNQTIYLRPKDLETTIDVSKLSLLEKQILEDFEKISPNQYSSKYIKIAENNRALLNIYSEQNVGVYILKKLLNSKKLTPSQSLYILNKLRVLNASSDNIVDNIKLTIEYLELAETLQSEYDISRAKIGLSSIIKSLGGYKTAITILDNIDLENKNFDLVNRIKISKLIHLSDCYFFIKDYNKALYYLNKVSALAKKEPEDYKNNIYLLKNLLEVQIYLNLNNSEKSLKILDSSKVLFENLQKIYFSDLNVLYPLILESYNLKYNFKEFDPAKIKKIIEISKNTGNVIFLEMSFDLLFKYYFKTNNLIEYRDLNLSYSSHLEKISDANNKFFTLYLIKDLEYDRFAKENKILYKHIGLLLISIFFIIAISYKKIKKLDHKSKIDSLTNIGNRLKFNNKLEELKNKNYYMLLFDIDNFKKLNDTYGHDFGDEVLSTIGKVLKTIENKEITIYRVGGEEFTVIFTNLNMGFSIDTCEYIRKIIENIKWKHPITITISGGFSQNNDNTYIECDLRLYEAKKSGKNMIIYQELKK